MIHKSLKCALAIHTIQVFISFHFIWIVVLDVKFPANSFVDCAVSVPIFLVWFSCQHLYLCRVTAQDEKKKSPTNSKRKIKMNTKKKKNAEKKNSKKNLCVCCICFIFFSLVQCNLFAAFFLNVYHAEVKREDAIKWCI